MTKDELLEKYENAFLEIVACCCFTESPMIEEQANALKAVDCICKDFYMSLDDQTRQDLSNKMDAKREE